MESILKKAENILNVTYKEMGKRKIVLIDTINAVVRKQCDKTNLTYIDLDDDDALSLETCGETTNDLLTIYMNGQLGIKSSYGRIFQRELKDLDVQQLTNILSKLLEVL